MNLLVDARPHLDAIKAAIADAMGSDDVYDHSDVPGRFGNPGDLPDVFVLVAVERRYSPVLRSAHAGNVGWRVIVTALGTTVAESAWVLSRVADALNEQRLIIASQPTTRIQFESDTAPKFDDDRFTADAFYTYAH